MRRIGNVPSAQGRRHTPALASAVPLMAWLAAWILVSHFLPPSLQAQQPRLRLVTYNIHHGVGNDSCADAPAPLEGADCGLNLQRVAEVLKRHRPDIVALQEVDRNWLRSAGSDQPAVFAHVLGMYACYGANLNLPPDLPGGRNREYGNLILSRFPITGCRNLPQPKATPEAEQRGLLLARINVDGHTLQLANTHLHTKPEDRMLQAKSIHEALRAIDAPIILMGDLNARPGDPELAYLLSTLRDAWQLAGKGPGLTSPASPSEPARNRIDYILLSPMFLVDRIEVDTTPIARTASDHHPVVASVVLRVP